MSIFAFRPLRWAIVVLLFVAALPSRSQDGYKYVGQLAYGKFASPASIAADPETGRIFVADQSLHQVFVLAPDGFVIKKFGSASSTAIGSFNMPYGVLVKQGKLWVSEYGANRVQVFDIASGSVVDSWGLGNVNRPASTYAAFGMSWTPSGDIAMISDGFVKRFSPDGVQSAEFGGRGISNGEFRAPYEVAVDAEGRYYVPDLENRRVQVFSPAGQWMFSITGGGSLSNPFVPYGVTIKDNKLFVSDANNSAVKVYTLDGAFLTEIKAPVGTTMSAWAITFDNQGRLLVVDPGVKCIRVFVPYTNDVTAPTSTAVLSPALDANGWTRGTMLNIAATDSTGGTGVKEIRYQVNGGSTVVVPGASATVPFLVDGTYQVKSWAVDVAGNIESAHTTAIWVDATAPVSGASIKGRTVTVQAWDALSGVVQILVSVDGKAETPYAGPITFDNNEHVMAYRAIDLVGNSELAHSVTVDGVRLAKLSATPLTLKGGGQLVVAVVLNLPAATGGLSVSVSSSSSSVTGASVVIPEGEMVALVPLSTSPVPVDTSVTLTASLGSSTASAVVSVLAEPMKVVVAPSDIVGGSSAGGSVVLSASAPVGGLKVTLSSNSPSVVVPSSVVVKAGQTRAVFTIRTRVVTSTTNAELLAKAGAWEYVAPLVIRTPELDDLDVDLEVGSGGSGTGTVLLSCPAPSGGTVISLSSSSKDVVVPSTVTVAQGDLTATFTIKALPLALPSSATITASLNGVSKSKDIAVSMAKLQGIAFSPSSVASGSNAAGTLSLNGIAAAVMNVSITSDNTALVPPQVVVVPKGKSLAAVLLKTNGVGVSTVVRVTATANNVSVFADLTLLPQPVASLKLDKSSVKGGSSVLGTVALATPAVADTVVRVVAVPSAGVTLPSTVVVKKGTKTITFTVGTLATALKKTVTISAETNGVAKTAVLSVLP